jgi:hypothetical protein
MSEINFWSSDPAPSHLSLEDWERGPTEFNAPVESEDGTQPIFLFRISVDPGDRQPFYLLTLSRGSPNV